MTNIEIIASLLNNALQLSEVFFKSEDVVARQMGAALISNLQRMNLVLGKEFGDDWKKAIDDCCGGE